MLSICGLECNKCKFFSEKCTGCMSIQGKPFWTKGYNMEVCQIYKCCINDKSLKHCGECSDLPCKTYDQLKHPKMSEEEHREELKIRVKRLKGTRIA